MKKQRKFLMVLPLLVLPFLTMVFWALGGGSGTQHAVAAHKGLDTDLPVAQFKEKQRSDKLSIYQAAHRDSNQNGISSEFLRSVGLDKSVIKDSTYNADAQADQINSKLKQLESQINGSEHPATEIEHETEPARVRHIKKTMRQMGTESSQADPELRQLDKMLDKIQAIQNPHVVKTETRAAEVTAPFRTVPAFVDGKQKVADGAVVKLKLRDTTKIKGVLLPKGQVLFGAGQIVNQRLLLVIKNIRFNDQIIPADLTVFSEDGLPGIAAPEAELSGVAGSNADQALQSMQLLTMDQSLGAQAAASGINTVKDLFSKKIKKIRVKLKDEYPVLLKIKK